MNWTDLILAIVTLATTIAVLQYLYGTKNDRK